MKRIWQRAGLTVLALTLVLLVAHRFLLAFTPWWVDVLFMVFCAVLFLALLAARRTTNPTSPGEKK